MKRTLAFKSPEGKNAVISFYDSLLGHWSLPNEKLYVHTRFGETFIIASGEKEAPPLILLHGSAMNSIMWLGDAPVYARNYRVYAVDIPGEPGRSDEHQLPFRGPAFADWLYDVFHALSIEKATLVGLSLGAWLALKFSVTYPEKVAKLVLLCPAGIGPQKVSFLISTAVHRLLGEKIRQRLFSKVNGNQSIPEVILTYQRLIDKNFNYRREIIPLFKDYELKRLTMPTALFVGEKDTIFHSAQTAERLGRLLPQASVNVLPGAGHALVNLVDRIDLFLSE